jgi:hypothetical protein
MTVKYEVSPGTYITGEESPKKKTYKATRHNQPENDHALPVGFETMRKLVSVLRENLIDKKSLYYMLYIDSKGLNLCASALESKDALDSALVRSLDSGERVMRVGPAAEIIGERIFDWDGIPDDFVWAVYTDDVADVDFMRHTFFSYQRREGENVNLNAATMYQYPNMITRGLNRAEVQRISDKRLELKNNCTAGYYAQTISEHRRLGDINPVTYGFLGAKLKLPEGLPAGSYTLHDILLGNYKIGK